MTDRPAFRTFLITALASTLTFFGTAQADEVFDLSPEQPARIRAEKNDAAIAAISKDFSFVSPGSSRSRSVPAGRRSPPMRRMQRPSLGPIRIMRLPLPIVSGSNWNSFRSPGSTGRSAWYPASTMRSFPMSASPGSVRKSSISPPTARGCTVSSSNPTARSA
jgi:hypothetical protein